MRRIIATALLCLHLFSIGGHIALYQYFVYKSDQFYNEQIFRNKYDRNDLVEVKIHTTVAIGQNWSNYESIRGQVQFRYACYNYVRLKMSKDTIYLMCIPNYQNTKLLTQNIINARQIPDIPVNKKDHVPFGKTPELEKYNCPVFAYRFRLPVSIQKPNGDNHYAYPIKHYIAIPDQPPELAA